MVFRPGQDKKGGRVKGTLNKVSKTAKESLIEVYERLGGATGMLEWAQDPENRTEFYRIWSKILPRDVVADIALRGSMTISRSEDQAALEHFTKQLGK